MKRPSVADDSGTLVNLTGTRSLSLSFCPEAGQWVSTSGFSTLVSACGVAEGIQNACRNGEDV
jgi:hypothetical protein